MSNSIIGTGTPKNSTHHLSVQTLRAKGIPNEQNHPNQLILTYILLSICPVHLSFPPKKKDTNIFLCPAQASEPPVFTWETLQSFSAQPLVSKAPPPQRAPLSSGRMVSTPW